jgi:heptaprenylglyceryl phosphate synthase
MHRNNIDMNILKKINNSKGEVAVLIDPENTFKKKKLEKLIKIINDSNISFIFVGGSTFKKLNLLYKSMGKFINFKDYNND